MKKFSLIIILLFSFSKIKAGKPIISSSKISSSSINANCTMGTIPVCYDSINRLCYCKIDFDSSPLKTTKKCTNETNLQWVETFKKFTPICMKIYPNQPLGCPIGYRLTNYKTNSSKLVSYCTKYFKSIFKSSFMPEHKSNTTKDLYIKHPSDYYNAYLLSNKTKKMMGYTYINKTVNKNK